MTRLVLVRHGESQVTVDDLIGGDAACTGLSDLGRQQAEALADRLKRTGELGEVHALYASTLPRAIETAEIIAPALGGLEIVQEHDVKEWDPGPEMDGLAWSEAEQAHPPVNPWSPHKTRYPGSETWAEFAHRVSRALHEIADRHVGETVVIACHGGVVEQSAVALMALPHMGEHVSFNVRNTSLTEWLRPDPDEPWWRPVGRWRLLRFNDAAHLDILG